MAKNKRLNLPPKKRQLKSSDIQTVGYVSGQ